MERRAAFKLIGSTAALAAFASSQADAGQEKGTAVPEGVFAKCAAACAACLQSCSACYHHCDALVGAGQKEHAKTMNLCVDCSEICATAANLAGRHGPLSSVICEACAKACDECGAACGKFPSHKQMKECAESCKVCAAVCREMTKQS